jgi:2-iminobutanoate/2-iminopropanoate deaminase
MKIVETPKGVKPQGPYSQGIVANGFVFVSGTVGIDPNTGMMVPGGINEQTKQTLENIKAVLEAAGSSIDKVVKASVFLKDGGHFKDMNAVYSGVMGTHKPCRTTVATGFARDDVLVEIDMIAVQ